MNEILSRLIYDAEQKNHGLYMTLCTIVLSTNGTCGCSDRGKICPWVVVVDHIYASPTRDTHT